MDEQPTWGAQHTTVSMATIGRDLGALDAAALGYAATACIHPSQVAVIREAYRPTTEQVEWARRLLAAAGDHTGAFNFEGRMVDDPLFRQAAAIHRRAEATTT